MCFSQKGSGADWYRSVEELGHKCLSRDGVNVPMNQVTLAGLSLLPQAHVIFTTLGVTTVLASGAMLNSEIMGH